MSRGAEQLMKFSEHLAFLREQEGLLQKDLAKALGISFGDE